MLAGYVRKVYFHIHASFQLQRQKMFLWTCVPSEDSDQPENLCSLIKIFSRHILDSQGCKVSSYEDSDKTAHTHTCTKEHFLMTRLIYMCILLSGAQILLHLLPTKHSKLLLAILQKKYIAPRLSTEKCQNIF